MPFLARDRVFVDESKSKAYILAATAVQPNDIAMMERGIRALVLPGQRRIHFKAESDARRRELLSRLVPIAPRVTVYAATATSDKVERAPTLARVVEDAVRGGSESLVIERDESLIVADRRFIRERLVAFGAVGALRYEHADPGRYPLLWVSDAVAWCAQAGGGSAHRRDQTAVEMRGPGSSYRPEDCQACFAGLLPVARSSVRGHDDIVHAKRCGSRSPRLRSASGGHIL